MSRRKDAKYTIKGKRANVRIPNASTLGYGRWEASPGNLVTFEVPSGNDGSTRTMHGRVIGRVDASGHDGDPVKGWIAVIALGTDISFAYEMWIDPMWVTSCRANGPEALAFFTAFLTASTDDLIRMSEYGSLGASPGRTNKLPPACKTCNGPRCGCSVNAPEADPKIYACPCGAHCTICDPTVRTAIPTLPQPATTKGV